MNVTRIRSESVKRDREFVAIPAIFNNDSKEWRDAYAESPEKARAMRARAMEKFLSEHPECRLRRDDDRGFAWGVVLGVWAVGMLLYLYFAHQ